MKNYTVDTHENAVEWLNWYTEEYLIDVRDSGDYEYYKDRMNIVNIVIKPNLLDKSYLELDKKSRQYFNLAILCCYNPSVYVPAGEGEERTGYREMVLLGKIVMVPNI